MSLTKCPPAPRGNQYRSTAAIPRSVRCVACGSVADDGQAPGAGPGCPWGLDRWAYTDEPKTFGGVVFPTRRRAFQRNDDGKKLTAITIDFDEIDLG
jgi:hypothetical protein